MDTERTNFFSVNVDKIDDADFEPDCVAFRTRVVPAEQRVSLEQTAEDLESITRKGSLPTSLEIIKDICLWACMVIMVGLMRREGSLIQTCKDDPGFFFAAVLFFAVWLSLKIYARVRRRRIEAQYPAEYADDALRGVVAASLEVLGIPENAPEVDVLSEGYALKKGKRVRKMAAMCPYANLPMRVFTEDGRLCIANMEERWDIPLSSFTRAVLVKKRPNLPVWNKPEPYTDEKYKPYKITTNNFGQFFARYYSIDIDDERGNYYLLVPEYDGRAIFDLIGIRPENE